MKKAAKLSELARELGLSTTTVWRALNHATDVRPATRERVLAKAAELEYHPNHAARTMVTGKSRFISLWGTTLTEGYSALVFYHLKQELDRIGYELIVRDLSDVPNPAQRVAEFVEWPVDGIISLDGLDWVCRDLVTLYKKRVATVCIGVGYDKSCDNVQLDLKGGAYQATRHLIATGRSRIAYMRPLLQEHQTEGPFSRRLQGYVRAMAEAGMAEEIIEAASSSRSSATVAIGQHIMKSGLPDAIFCFNDDMAISVYCRLRQLGYRVPEDVALVGFDGIRDTRYLDTPLSTVLLPVAEICRTACTFLQRRMEDPGMPPQRCILPTELAVRKSSSL